MKNQMNGRRLLAPLLLFLSTVCAASAASQYWDAATNAGYQHGDGRWTTSPADAWWTTNTSGLTPLDGWADGSIANFSGTGGRSTVLVDGSSISASGLVVNGSGYDVVVTNGGRLTVSGNFIVGYSIASSTNNRLSVIGGVGVTSHCSSVGSFWVSYSGCGNEVLVDGRGVSGSAVFSNSGGIALGYTAASSVSGRVAVCRGGRLVAPGGVAVGRSSPFNQLIVSEGGTVTAGTLDIGNGPNGDNSNTLVVTDSGSVVDALVLRVGGQRRGNQAIIANSGVVTGVATFILGESATVNALLTITNGGKLFTSGGVDFARGGSTACTGLISGAGSLWDLAAGILVVGQGTNNRVRIEDYGAVTNAGAIRIGAAASAAGNGLIISGGGRLHSSAASAVGYTGGTTGNTALVTGTHSLWDVGGASLSVGSAATTNNTLTITAGGRVRGVNLLAAATNNALRLQGGVLVAGRLAVTNDAAFAVGDGVQDAALVLTNKALPSVFAPGLRVRNRGSLLGSGVVVCGSDGIVVESGGALAPGIGTAGVFAITGDVSLQPGSELRLELAGTNGPGTGWDALSVTNGTLALGGALKPALQSGFVPAPDDRFVIVTNRGPGAVTGRFGNAGNGQAVTVYGEDGTSKAGLLTVEIGERSVTLSGFRDYQELRGIRIMVN